MTASARPSRPAIRQPANRAWRLVHVLMTLAFGTAMGACFNAPDEPVLFACDAETAPACPDGYSCADDGCCHRDGSDIAANLNSCRIGGAMSATDSGASSSSSSGASSSSSADTGSSAASTTT